MRAKTNVFAGTHENAQSELLNFPEACNAYPKSLVFEKNENTFEFLHILNALR